MRTRTREVQIFNMSLIDILCGALGAFCFMMLVLLPYYKPPGSAADLQKEQTKTQDLLKELEKLKDAAKDSALAQQMADLSRQLEAQIKQLQGEVNQLTAQNQQLKTENQQLAARNDKQSSQLDMRRPFFTMAVASPPQDLDVYLDSDGMTEDKKSNPPFDPIKPHQNNFFTGDVSAWWPDQGVTVWMTRDTPIGVHYKLYVKIPPSSDAWSAVIAPAIKVKVKSRAVGGDWRLDLPDVNLNPAQFWTLVGTFAVNPDGKLGFKEATQSERDAEWTKLSKGATPPPAQPAATAAPVMPFSSPAVQPTVVPPEEQARRKQLHN
jgi:hypothetical protein